MKSLGVAVIDLKKEVCARLGKKGSSSDYTIFNRKSGEDVFCFYEPSLYPDKLVSLLHCLNSADVALLVFDGVSKEAGEAIVALDCIGLKGVVCFRDGSKEELASIAKGTAVENFIECALDDAEILSALSRLSVERDEKAPVQVTVDSSFKVKSVGLVVLGIVKRGVVSVHDELTALPSGKKAVVRSIQVQDKDVKSASAGDRVGMCLKNVEPEDVERGAELVKGDGFVAANEVSVEAQLSKFQKAGVSSGASVFVSFGMQFAGAGISDSISPGEKKVVELSFQKPFAFEKRASALLAEPTRPLRILGKLVFQ